MVLQKIEKIYEDRDYLIRIKAVHIFVFNIFTVCVSVFATVLYLDRGFRPGYLIVLASSLLSVVLILTKKFEQAVALNLIAGLFSVTAGWFFGAKDGNYFFSISVLILVYLYLSNIRNTILVSLYCFGLLTYRALHRSGSEIQNLISFADTLVMYSIFAMIAIMMVRVIQNYTEEKDVLIKEIHHRVRNNLQVLSGLIDLQRNVLPSESGKHLSEFQNRLFAISKVHDYVYKCKNYNRVDCLTVFEEILSNLISSTSSESVLIEKKIENVQLPIETVIPLALIFNEALLNSFVHGKNQDSPSKLTILLENLGPICRLSVADNGPGISDEAAWREPSTIGFTLIRILAKQLKGDLKVTLEGGTSIEFEFDPSKSSLSI